MATAPFYFEGSPFLRSHKEGGKPWDPEFDITTEFQYCSCP